MKLRSQFYNYHKCQVFYAELLDKMANASG